MCLTGFHKNNITRHLQIRTQPLRYQEQRHLQLLLKSDCYFSRPWNLRTFGVVNTFQKSLFVAIQMCIQHLFSKFDQVAYSKSSPDLGFEALHSFTLNQECSTRRSDQSTKTVNKPSKQFLLDLFDHCLYRENCQTCIQFVCRRLRQGQSFGLGCMVDARY